MIENNAASLYELLGWQGGTIHQLAQEFNVPVTDLLYGKPETTICSDSDWIKGQYAHDACSKEFVRSKLLEMYRGNKDFWLGYMRAAYLQSI